MALYKYSSIPLLGNHMWPMALLPMPSSDLSFTTTAAKVYD